jgi:hypothetical protein
MTLVQTGKCRICGVSSWHPEVRSCPLPTCGLRTLPASGVGADPFTPRGSAPTDHSPVHNGLVPSTEARHHVP